jgi:hypothetical protein
MNIFRGQSPEVVIALFVPARPLPADLAATFVLAELSSILCANSLPWQEFSALVYRLRYIAGWKGRLTQTA